MNKKVNKEANIHCMANAVKFDRKKCIGCSLCVMTCKYITGYLKMDQSDSKNHVEYNSDPSIDCIYCGQCTLKCPIGAISEQKQIEDVENALKDKKKITIAQMAPATRASIGEAFGMEPGVNLEGKMNTALKKIGFDYVFDVTMGADITTHVEAIELIERIKNGGERPMITSCCPSWVKYVEFYHQELIPNLTTARSPQIHAGGAYKTWWAGKNKIDPKDIIVVSLMPCTSKKFEASLEKLKVNGLNPVDYVLTIRETAELLKKHNIDPTKLKSSNSDSLGKYTGAGIIFGTSGGVMESTLRSAYYYITGKEIENIEFKQVRDSEGIKDATIKIEDITLNVGIVHTIKNMEKIIEDIKNKKSKYDYLEVMACPSGCIGGGGHPTPVTPDIIKARKKVLYNIDDKTKLRKAYKNPIVKEFFEDYVEKFSPKKQAELLHTHYKKISKKLD